MRILIHYFSNQGGTESLAQFIHSLLPEADVVANQFVSWEDYDLICFGTYTWGNGIVPKHVQKHIDNNIDNVIGKKVIVFGTGNSTFNQFCVAVDIIEQLLSPISEVVATLKADIHYENLAVDVKEEFVMKVKEIKNAKTSKILNPFMQ